jgi:hypothetical protein
MFKTVLTHLRRLLSWDTLIVVGAALFLWSGISCGLQWLEGFGSLRQQSGVLASKEMKIEQVEQEKRYRLLVCLEGSTQVYTIQNHPKAADNLTSVGDSVTIWTRKPSAWHYNFTGDGLGAVRSPAEPNEVYHMTTPRYGVLVDFNKFRSNLVFGFFGFLFAGLLFAGWYYYRRAGISHPLIIED